MERLHVAAASSLLVVVALACKSSGSAAVTTVESEAAPATSASAAPAIASSPLAAIERPDVVVSAAQLLKDYKGNEVRGDAKYKGKRVRVVGTVNAIKKDATDSIYVTMGTGGELDLEEVQCFFDDKYTKQAAMLTRGQKLTADCTDDGMLLTDVMLKDCDFVTKAASMEACHKLEAAGIASACVAMDPDGKRESTAFRIAGADPKAAGAVFAYRDAAFDSFIASPPQAKPGDKPLLFFVSRPARIVVAIVTDPPPADVQAKIKAAVDAF